MKKIQLSQATWLEYESKTYKPGDVIDIDDVIADSLVTSGSAIYIKEVKRNADKAGSNSSKA